ncbi:MAG: GNAT family N-acetyltransferase [Ignavibacteria bacterium]
MAEYELISNRDKIGKFLLRDPANKIYLIGDLDPFFFPRTKWFAMSHAHEIEELALLYEGDVAITLLAFPDGDVMNAVELLEHFASQLPQEFYAHLGCGIMKKLKSFSAEEDFGTHLKMLLKEPDKLLVDTEEKIHRLGVEDEQSLLKLYEKHYPGNYFDKRMLETGKYFGYFENKELIGVAGIHVYSPVVKVAALGNIVVAGEQRGKGICRKLVSTLCKDLLKTVDVIGLNVHSENLSAITCYERCGFEVIGEYEEFLLKRLTN